MYAEILFSSTSFVISVESQCDWPANVDCEVTVEKARKLQRENPTVIYLTFDDGPNEGTPYVLVMKLWGEES